VQNIVALYGVQAAAYVFPLITVPYLARVLGPEGWGKVAMAQAFGQYLAIVVEYGFGLSATREVARARDSLERRAELLAGVMGAKALLALPAVGLAWLASRRIAAFRDDPLVLWAGVFWALASAFNLMWYFQGLERMRFVAALDVGARAGAVAAIFLWVRAPEDGWKVLILTGTACVFSMSLALNVAYREVPFRLPTLREVWNALRTGWNMFVFRGAVSLYTVGNTFILGLFAVPQVVGYYAGAEKISRALVGFLGPVSQALYPRLSHLVGESRAEAARLARLGLGVMGLVGLALGLSAFALAPWLVRVLLGPDYAPAVPALRILALLPFLVALSNVLGIQWMLPLGLERPFNTIILVAGILNLSLAVLLAPPLAQVGMACAVVAAEASVTGSMYLYLRMRALNPAALGRVGRIPVPHERRSAS